jgi:hypothetical protein
MAIPDFAKMREQCEQTRAQKSAAFPYGVMVQVNNERFHGIGFVDRDESCPLEKLPVRVESLNVWWYPIEDCQVYAGRMPSWIRSWFRRHNMTRVDHKAFQLAVVQMEAHNQHHE